MNNSTESNSVGRFLGPGFMYSLATILIIIVLVAICGNLLVCFAIAANRTLRNNPTNMFIFSLAFSDLLTVSIAVPFDIEGLLVSWIWTHGELVCQTWITVYLITVPTSILTLLAVSVDRYKSISDPLNRFRRARFMTHKRALISVTTIWVYSLLFALIPVMGWRTKETFTKNNRCYFPFPNLYSTLSSVINFILPLLMTCGIYIKIYQIARRQQAGSWRLRSSEEGTAYSKNIQAAKTISMFVCAIFFCWVPFSTVSIFSTLCSGCIQPDISLKVNLLLLSFGYLNSALNPFLFAFRNKSFKATYSKLFSALKSRSVAVPVGGRRRSTLTQSTFASEFHEHHESDLRLYSAVKSPPKILTKMEQSAL